MAWLSERKDVLYTFYFFATLILYLLYLRSGQWLWLAAALVTFLLSLLAKGQAVSLAPSLVLIDWVRGRKMLSSKVLAEKIPFFALALVFGLVAIQAQAHGQAIHRIDEYPYSVRIVFAAYGFSQYLFKLIVPHSMAAIYPYPIFDDFPPMFYVAHLLPALAVLGVTLWL